MVLSCLEGLAFFDIVDSFKCKINTWYAIPWVCSSSDYREILLFLVVL